MPAVSVIIPAYNQGHYLSACVQSVLDQTYQDFEILIVDDGSTDQTRDIAARFSDPRVRYLYQDNRGLSGARNTGIRNATGAFITYLDSDDQFLPQKLELLIHKFEAEPDLGFVAGQAILIDESGQKLGETFDAPPPGDPIDLLLGNPLHVGSILLRHEWQMRAGFFDETLRSYEDWEMWLRLARLGCKMGWVPRPVSLYRFHREQMTRDDQQMTTATFAVLDKVYRDPHLPSNWHQMRSKAYSQANLRGAAQAYTAQAYDRAQAYLAEAVRLNPELVVDQMEPLAKIIAGWANYAKTPDPLAFLESVYDHLPTNLSVLRRRRSHDLADAAIQIAFAAYFAGDLAKTRSAVGYAFRRQPKWILNRGARSLFVRSRFHTSTDSKTQNRG